MLKKWFERKIRRTHNKHPLDSDDWVLMNDLSSITFIKQKFIGFPLVWLYVFAKAFKNPHPKDRDILTTAPPNNPMIKIPIIEPVKFYES